jgi:hypothetical protein
VGYLTITPAPLTGTVDNKERQYSDPDPTFTVSYSGFKNGENLATSDVNTSGLSFDCPAIPTTPVSSSPVPINAIGLTSNNYDISYVSGYLTITKKVLTVSDIYWPTLTDAATLNTYGAKLSMLNFLIGSTGSTFIKGVSWVDGDILPDVGTFIKYEASITSRDTDNYDWSYIPSSAVSKTYEVTVTNKAEPGVVFDDMPTLSPDDEYYYGDKASVKTIVPGTMLDVSGNPMVGGSWDFDDANEVMYLSLTYVMVWYTPSAADSDNYDKVKVPIGIKVFPATPTISIPPSLTVTAQLRLNQATFPTQGTVLGADGAPITGNWTVVDPVAGNAVHFTDNGKSVLVRFTPNSGNYTWVEGYASLTVTKIATSVSTLPGVPGPYTVGQRLDTQLLSTGGVVVIAGLSTTVSGKWTFASPGLLVPTAASGTSMTVDVIFTPDNTDYAPITTTTTVPVS